MMNLRCQDCDAVITQKREVYRCSCGLTLCASCALAHEFDRGEEATDFVSLESDELRMLERWNALVRGEV